GGVWGRGATMDGGPGRVTIPGPTFSSLTPTPLPPTSPTPIVVKGSGFGAVGAGVVVQFVAAAGTPFAGGTTATANVPGTIESATRVHATSPAPSRACVAPTVLVKFS